MNITLEGIMRWGIPLVIAIMGFVIGLVFEKILIKALHKIADATKWKWDDVLAKAVSNLFLASFIILGVWGGVVYAPITPQAESFIVNILSSLATLVATLFLARVAEGFITLGLARMNAGLGSTSLISKSAKLLILGIGVVFVINNYVEITPVIGALGIGGLAAALALKDTLSNFFSGFQIIATRQVRPGDYVKLWDGELGRVTDVNWRNVTICSHPDENLIIVPNSKLASNVMTNYNLPKQLLMEKVNVGVAYESDLEHVEQVILETAATAVEKVSERPVKFPPKIRFREFGDFAIKIEVRLYLPKLKGRGVYKNEFIKSLHKRFKEEGISIPYPVRNIQIERAKSEEN
jgi:small-conductance mechanosensitive channel